MSAIVIIGVRCDGPRCHDQVDDRYEASVSEIEPEVQLERERAIAEYGWTCVGGKDLCPKHGPSAAEAEPKRFDDAYKPGEWGL